MSRRNPNDELAIQVEIGLDSACKLISEFYSEIGDAHQGPPQDLTQQILETRIRWMREELDELLIADSIEERIDAICDLTYFALGCFVLMGIKPGKAFLLVHQANKRKITSEVIKGPDTKVIKPTDWTGPEREIRNLLDRGLLSLKSD